MNDPSKENKQAVDCKSALPCSYLAHEVDSGWLFDQGQTLAILETPLDPHLNST
jgi:hypothetical protein